MTSKEQLKKLMSVGTNKKVNDLLFKLDHTESSNILVYINRNLERYRKRVFQYRTMFRQKRKELPVDSDEYLDLKYQTWTYTDGYYHQQALMYELIGRTLRLLIEQSRKGCRKTCQKTRKKT